MEEALRLIEDSEQEWEDELGWVVVAKVIGSGLDHSPRMLVFFPSGLDYWTIRLDAQTSVIYPRSRRGFFDWF